MRFIDIFTLILSFLGVYGIVYSLRLLLPRNIVPLVSTSLNEAMALLGHAEAINIPNMNDYRPNLAMYARGCTQLLLSLEPTDRTQPSQPIPTHAYGEPSLSGVFPAVPPAFSLRSDVEVV